MPSMRSERIAMGLNIRTSMLRMTVDGEQHVVGRHRAEIVEQQAHAHTAVGRAEQALEQNPAHHVLVPDEILHIETALRRIREDEPRGQGIARVRERVQAGLARMRRDARPHRRRQRSASCVLQRQGRRTTAALGQARAGGECRSDGGEEGEGLHMIERS